jgi:hypothetical protein
VVLLCELGAAARSLSGNLSENADYKEDTLLDGAISPRHIHFGLEGGRARFLLKLSFLPGFMCMGVLLWSGTPIAYHLVCCDPLCQSREAATMTVGYLHAPIDWI